MPTKSVLELANWNEDQEITLLLSIGERRFSLAG